MPRPTGEQIQENTTPVDRLVTSTPNNSIHYDDAGDPVDSDNLKVFDSGDVEVKETMTANVKLFTIQHPNQEGMILRHGCLEGPEHGVYHRGSMELSDDEECQVDVSWPDYWKGLVRFDTITVHLTPYGKRHNPFVVEIDEEGFSVDTRGSFSYVCYASRADVDQLKIVSEGRIRLVKDDPSVSSVEDE